MLPWERVAAALNFSAPDKVPVQIHPSPAGLYEHGRKLLDRMLALGHDFGDLSELTMPVPPHDDFDGDGRYHSIKTDEWGITWEFRLYGVWGHPLQQPLKDLARLPEWECPSPPSASGLSRECTASARTRSPYFMMGGGGSIWERLYFLHGFEDSLIDIQLDTPEINRLADILVEYCEGCIEYSLAAGRDAVAFGDDFGTQHSMLFPPAVWRKFFKPRYDRLFAPIRKAGVPIIFHSCGQVMPLLEDFAELGVNAIWPQLPLYDIQDLSRRCHDLRLAVQLHPDRSDLMQGGTGAQVRDYLTRLLDVFDTGNGGSWLYIEIDPGFRWEAVDALLTFADGLRG